jgi:hypothetical protein
MQFSATRSLLQGIFDGAKEGGKDTKVWSDDDVIASALQMVGEHQVVFKGIDGFPEESGQIQKLVDESRTNGKTTQGAPMGLGTTWPLLAIMHRFATIRGISKADRKRVALKGDDALLHFTQKSYDTYLRNLSDLGLKINLTKTHKSKTGGVFCGKFVTLDNELGRFVTIRTPKMSAILLAKREGLRGQASKVPTEVALGPALRAELVGVDRETKERVSKTVNWYHSKMLFKMRKTGIPLCWPRALGGYDMPGRAVASEFWRKASANHISGYTGQSGNPIGWGALWTLDEDESELRNKSRKLADAALEKVQEVLVMERAKGGTILKATTGAGTVTVSRSTEGMVNLQSKYIVRQKPDSEMDSGLFDEINDAWVDLYMGTGAMRDHAFTNNIHDRFNAMTAGVGVIRDDQVQATDQSEEDYWVGLPERRVRTALMTSIESKIRQTSVFSSAVEQKKDPEVSSNFRKRAKRVISVAHKLFDSRPGVKPVNEKHIRELSEARRGYGERLLSVGGVLNVCAFLGLDFHRLLRDLEIESGRPPAWCRLAKRTAPTGIWAEDNALRFVIEVNDDLIKTSEYKAASPRTFDDRTLSVMGLLPEPQTVSVSGMNL